MEHQFTRTYLESLATDELIGIADKLDVDVPQNHDRIVIIEELLDISASSETEDDTSGGEEKKDLIYLESVPLPRFYNVTFIEAMIRDPFWAFVFWEIKSADKEQMEKAADFGGYYLKVSLLNAASQKMEELFTVQVKPDDTAWYLSFAQTLANESSSVNQIGQKAYKVELCADMGGAETVLTISNTISLPGLPELPGRAGRRESTLDENQLIRLSGYDDFRTLRRNERLFRTKKGHPAQK